MRTHVVLLGLIFVISCTNKTSHPPGFVETKETHSLQVADGIHLDTGLKDDPNLPLVIANCTACHSAKMIIQNQASREGWKEMITWMQQTQNLWDLGENEPIILDYLEKNYSPDKGQIRRKNLENIDWYTLD